MLSFLPLLKPDPSLAGLGWTSPRAKRTFWVLRSQLGIVMAKVAVSWDGWLTSFKALRANERG